MAFVLSGGGNLGALQVGMLRALLERGVRPDLVVGCSVGAINGAGFADDPTPGHVDELERLWIALDGQNLLPSGWSNAVSLARRGEAIHDHEGLRRMAEEALRSRTFEDLDLHFECVATDVAGAEEVWFDSGQLIDPILASSALPAIYPPVEIDGVRYLDGGIVNDVPMSRAVELGAATIYILQVGAFLRPRPEPRRPLDVALQAYWVARHHRFKRELGALPPDVAVHVLPTGETPRMRFNDFTHSATLVARAHEATARYLSDVAAGRPPTGVPGDAAVRGLRRVAGRGNGDNGSDATAAETGHDEPDRGLRREAAARGNGSGGEPPGSRIAAERDVTAEGPGATVGGNGAGRGLRRVTRRDKNGAHPAARADVAPGHGPPRRNGQRRHAEPPAGDEPDGGLYIPAGAEEPGDVGDPDEPEPVGVRRWAKATRLRRLGERVHVFDGGDQRAAAPATPGGGATRAGGRRRPGRTARLGGDE